MAGAAHNFADDGREDPPDHGVLPPKARTGLIDRHVTDLRVAERFRDQFGDVARHVPAWGWKVFDGVAWRSNNLRQVEQMAMQTVASLWDEVALLPTAEAKLEFTRQVVKAESAGRLHAIADVAASLEPIVCDVDTFDQDPWLFTVANGTLDLRDRGGDINEAVAGVFRAHRADDYITRASPITFDARATAPTWDQFLRRIFANRDGLIRFLQRAIGYALTGHTNEHALFFCHGSGNNGKTSLLEALRSVFGEYAAQTEFTSFLASDRDRTRNDLARLAGARFVIATEAPANRRFDEAAIKQITGGDVVTARFLFKEYFEFTPRFKLFLAANHRPQVRGTDHGIWRRLRLIPFDVTIPAGEQDHRLLERLKAEASGILRWAVEGCVLWQREGLDTCVEVSEATQTYRDDSDVLAPFMAERCTIDAAHSVPAGALHDAYRGWCERHGERAMSLRTFGEALTERGFGRRKDTLGRILRTGISVRSEQSGQSG